MKKLAFFLILICCMSCFRESEKKVTHGREINSMRYTAVLNDDVSIRAIDVSDTHLWYAGSDGKYGSIDLKLGGIEKGKVQFDTLNPSFRMIDVVGEQVFMMSIASPGIIYKRTGDQLDVKYMETGEKVFYDCLKFWDEKNGIAVGDPQEGCFSVLITNDGGESWNKIGCDILPAVEDGEAAFAASNSNIALYDEHVWIVTGGKMARVMHSPDRGKSWKALNTPMISGGEMTGIYSIAMHDENTGVIMGGDWNDMDNNEGNLAITHDGGKSWKLIAEGSGPGYRSHIMYVRADSDQELLATGSKGISYSNDGGESWTPLTDLAAYVSVMVNEKEGYTAGNGHITKFELIEKEN